MADLMAGPNAPLSRAFIWCGWSTITVDWLLDKTHDLSDSRRQASLHDQLQSVCFIAAALDCSTKSRAREIPRTFQDGRPAPKPLRSEEFPEGLPDLPPHQAQRVESDNIACDFVLQEIEELAQRGGTSLRENPWRSLHWHLPRERAMFDTNIWSDTHYSSCVFAGARCKSQRLRHNVEEINAWPPLDCQHSHDPKEWDPYLVDGKAVFPSKEEAEYTAPLSFAIAVAVSWCACRTSKAKLHVPRMPVVERHGRREHWLYLDARCMREWAMSPLAISLCLRPPDPREAARIPTRGLVADLISADGDLPEGCVYVGRGHHSHRLQTTEWSSPAVPGFDCSEDEWICRYVDFVCTSGLWDKLPQLQGRTLVCDCPWQSLCEADLLAGLVFEATSPQPRLVVHQAGGPARQASSRRAVLLASSARLATGLPASISPFPWSQESVVLAFQKLFPADWFASFSFPWIEDLLNQPPFSLFPEWLAQQGLDWDGPLVPQNASKQGRLLSRHADGQQAGAHCHRAALPPLLPFGLSPDEHFEASLLRAQGALPFEALPPIDDDLKFVAEIHRLHRGKLQPMRKKCLGALKELKRRWCKVGKILRHHQTPAIQAVTAKRDLGLVALLILLSSWSDTGYPYGLIKGLPAVGFAPHYGIFPLQEAEPLTIDDVLNGWESHNARILTSLKPGKDDAFLLSQSLQDAEKGFCSQPLTRSALLRLIKAAPHRLIPRCVITQSSGKQRIIDNADDGGQSERSSDSNKLVLCSPFRPAQQISWVLSGMTPSDLKAASLHDAWLSGGEDWPDAYRHSPMGEVDALGCVVTWWHEQWQQPAFQVYTVLQFGLPLAVTSFNRYSRLVEALGRRLCLVLVSMYFDDANIVDWRSSAGSGQAAFNQLNDILGTPFAQEKEQLMSSEGTFLGLVHQLEGCIDSGLATFWVKPKLQEKLQSIIKSAQTSAKLTSGQASKLYGLANFLELAIYGRVGCGGLSAIKQRQYESAVEITPAVALCFEVLLAIIACRPVREFHLRPIPCDRFVVASDAALEEASGGSGGFLIVWLQGDCQLREGFVADIPDSLYDLWTPGDKKIAQLELMMVLYVLITRPAFFRGRRGIWFIDNLAALMSLIRGRSSSPDLDRISSMIHVALFALRCWTWWEYIPSKSNWSDSISRLGLSDPWHSANHFSSSFAFFPLALWDLPFRALVLVFEYV